MIGVTLPENVEGAAGKEIFAPTREAVVSVVIKKVLDGAGLAAISRFEFTGLMVPVKFTVVNVPPALERTTNVRGPVAERFTVKEIPVNVNEESIVLGLIENSKYFDVFTVPVNEAKVVAPSAAPVPQFEYSKRPFAVGFAETPTAEKAPIITLSFVVNGVGSVVPEVVVTLSNL